MTASGSVFLLGGPQPSFSPDCARSAGSDKKIKEFEEAPGSGTQITKEIDAGTNLTQICLLPNAKVMFAATENGSLRTYKFPLTGGQAGSGH